MRGDTLAPPRAPLGGEHTKLPGTLPLDSVDQDLLNLLQNDFPLVERPYAEVGAELGISETECIDRVSRLKSGGLIREISAIFDSVRLGYRSILVALQVPESRLDEVGRMVSLQPGVSHSYARDHRYNLWFTLTVPPGLDAGERARAIQGMADIERALLLPSLRRFKIGVSFDVRENPEARANGRRSGHPVGQTAALGNPLHSDGASPQPCNGAMSELETSLVRELQRDLAADPRPFLGAATRLGMTQPELLAHARGLQLRGVMRRFAAVLRHRAAGFMGNGMSCWVVPKDRVQEIGWSMAGWASVTHCYERPTFPDWPYNVFGMLHARTREECLRDAAALSVQVGIRDYVVLFSSREYRKERVRYFEAS